MAGSARRQRRIGRWGLILGVIALAPGGCRRQSDRAASNAVGRPNVLLVVLDTTRPDFFSCYGHSLPTTPNIDRLASEGVRFDRAYTTDFWTLPSHASLFTGLYPTEAQATSETLHLPAAATTLAEIFRRNGYRTAAVVQNSWISRERGFSQGFDEFHEMWRETGEAAAVAPRVASAIDKLLQEGAKFFAFVNINVPHLPYAPPPGLFDRFASQRWPTDRVKSAMKIKGMWEFFCGMVRLTEADFRLMRELYQAEIAVSDAMVGRIIDGLRDRGVLDDTLVILTSDHGENIGDHGMIDHLLSMYESTLHVPLIVRYPERFPAGTTRTHLVSLVDVLPTALDACNLHEEMNATLEPRSLCADGGLERKFIVAENDRPLSALSLVKKLVPGRDVSDIDVRMRMVRTETHKLVWRSDRRVELFDLAADPGELKNVADEHPAVLSELRGYLDEWTRHVEANRITEKPPTFNTADRQTIESLKALGYVHDED